MPTKPPAPRGKRSIQKKTHNEESRFSALAKITKASVEKYNKVKNTSTAYLGNIRRCKEFLAQQIKIRRESHVIICELGIPTEELEKALDHPPNEYSAMVIEMFITEKCFMRNCKEQVAEGIHAAFCRYWDTM